MGVRTGNRWTDCGCPTLVGPGSWIGRGWRFRETDLDELFTENLLDRVLGEEAKAVLADPKTEWVPLEQVK